MLSAYHWWIFDNHKLESVESLREWVLQEVEFKPKPQPMGINKLTQVPILLISLSIGQTDAKKVIFNVTKVLGS